MSNAVNFYVFAIFMLNITKSQKLIKFCFLNQFSGQFFSPEDMIFGYILSKFCAGFLKICRIELTFISKVSACFERILFESHFDKNFFPKKSRITGRKFRCVKVEIWTSISIEFVWNFRFLKKVFSGIGIFGDDRMEHMVGGFPWCLLLIL